MAFANSKNQTKQNLKKAFRSKLSEICKTRTTKSSPDMFNFYVVFAGHDMVTDAGRTTTCRRKIKPHEYKQKYNKRTFPKYGFQRENRLKISDKKK